MATLQPLHSPRSFTVRDAFFLLPLALVALSGCDSFNPSDALFPLFDVSTDLATLQTETAWVVAAAVSNGRAYAFPVEGFSASFAVGGVVSGDVSANGYAGRYTVAADGSLSVEDVRVTLVGGSEESELLASVFLGELQQAERFEIRDRTLQVLSANGDGVRFSAGGLRRGL